MITDMDLLKKNCCLINVTYSVELNRKNMCTVRYNPCLLSRFTYRNVRYVDNKSFCIRCLSFRQTIIREHKKKIQRITFTSGMH